jgi:hypothetical protein
VAQQPKPIRLRLVIFIVSGLLLAGILVAIGSIATLYMQGAYQKNKAETTLAPLLSMIKKQGGHEICFDGDNGYGGAGITAWYDAYFSMNDSQALTNTVKGDASVLGYPLSVDADATLSGFNGTTNSNQQPKKDESDYLISTQKAGILRVQVARDTVVTLYCGNVPDGTTKQATGGKAIIFVSLALKQR